MSCPMRFALPCLALILLLASPARAQEPAHQWKVLGEAARGVVYLEDTANVERAGSKRQIWMNMRQTTTDTAGVAHTSEFVSVVMFDCGTYQVKTEGDGWRDIDLNPGNVYLTAIKSVCPAEK